MVVSLSLVFMLYACIYIYIYTRRHEFKSWIKLIAFHIALMPLGKV